MAELVGAEPLHEARNALGAEQGEKLRRFEAEVLWIVAAGDAVKLECLVGAALREKHFAEHPVGAHVPGLRRDGAPKGALGFLEAQLPPQHAAVVVERIGPIGDDWIEKLWLPKAQELIATHGNTDFDAFAAMLAARRLYPTAIVCVAGSLNRNVREFARLHADDQIARSAVQLEKARQIRTRVPLSRTFNRHSTITPPSTPPALVCPSCDTPLTYQDSHIGGVSEQHREQWDYFECPAHCGRFQYRQRTRKLRKLT